MKSGAIVTEMDKWTQYLFLKLNFTAVTRKSFFVEMEATLVLVNFDGFLRRKMLLTLNLSRVVAAVSTKCSCQIWLIGKLLRIELTVFAILPSGFWIDLAFYAFTL